MQFFSISESIYGLFPDRPVQCILVHSSLSMESHHQRWSISTRTNTPYFLLGLTWWWFTCWMVKLCCKSQWETGNQKPSAQASECTVTPTHTHTHAHTLVPPSQHSLLFHLVHHSFTLKNTSYCSVSAALSHSLCSDGIRNKINELINSKVKPFQWFHEAIKTHTVFYKSINTSCKWLVDLRAIRITVQICFNGSHSFHY